MTVSVPVDSTRGIFLNFFMGYSYVCTRFYVPYEQPVASFGHAVAGPALAVP